MGGKRTLGAAEPSSARATAIRQGPSWIAIEFGLVHTSTQAVGSGECSSGARLPHFRGHAVSSFEGSSIMAEHNGSLVAAEAEAVVSDIIRARRMRANLFRPEFFSDPAWDLLLVLFQADLRQHRVSAAKLTAATGLPPTTTGRWIVLLEREGLLRRRPDPRFATRTFIELSSRGMAAMQQWLQMWLESHSKPAGSSRTTDLLTRISRS